MLEKKTWGVWIVIKGSEDKDTFSRNTEIRQAWNLDMWWLLAEIVAGAQVSHARSTL
eukprot:COSAG02_NODE_530_length_20697_cov_20.103457_20_plen_57_part_00